ncbi:uncharacterized protein LOC100823317 [Brachypodium distachyon]|uniref:Oxidoreductase-like domain-containing protein n=1 Tax=Brachypodium distachyon TaxID=15368 RepID=I1IS48_BRADI|nr:uncharacterized protein LOC100823317 [Brachypodium distachyon]KQJ91163.1 hypothetical protein BRADI_4g36010v3 [Brachypodium distachyon]|eukprot:XP_003578495.3 uncharacterized protein LOC100823317 [Brachypodium distachyon]
MLGSVLRVPAAPIPHFLLPAPARPALRLCRRLPQVPMADAKKPDAALSAPEPPEKPLPGDCCGSGCVRCVWDVYYEDLEDYQKALAAHSSSSPPAGDKAASNKASADDKVKS